jgi:hypothetical protein
MGRKKDMPRDYLQEFLQAVGAREFPFGLRGYLWRFGDPSQVLRIVKEDSGRVLYLRGNDPAAEVKGPDDLPEIPQKRIDKSIEP